MMKFEKSVQFSNGWVATNSEKLVMIIESSVDGLYELWIENEFNNVYKTFDIARRWAETAVAHSASEKEGVH